MRRPAGIVQEQRILEIMGVIMKCPHCNKDIRESLVLSEAARINGRRQGRRDGG